MASRMLWGTRLNRKMNVMWTDDKHRNAERAKSTDRLWPKGDVVGYSFLTWGYAINMTIGEQSASSLFVWQ